MKSKVFVTTDNLGNTIRQSKNPEYGHVRIVQDRITINTSGWVSKKSFSALIHGTIDDLKAMGLEHATSLPGNIIVRESTIPFDQNNPDKNLKVAGDTGIVLCTNDGEPIYRKCMYDPSGCMEDELIPHANTEEIRKHIELQNKIDNSNDTEEPEALTDFQKTLDFDNLDNDEDDTEDVEDALEEEYEEIEFEIE